MTAFKARDKKVNPMSEAIQKVKRDESITDIGDIIKQNVSPAPL